ncbi:hypothetical protein LP414_04760 [Polaromonas sp. P1(28)-13]|nr:hypothetical protein LP414_04760 [Polaromonas sp. P1(28)-13]
MIHPIEGGKDTMRDLHLRRVAVFVYEPDPGDFYWVLIESKDDAYMWLDIEGAQEPHPTWIRAFEAGNTTLLKLVADQNMGPLAPVEDENASPLG